MTDFLADSKTRPESLAGSTFSAVIADAPGDFDEKVYVTIPAFDPQLQWGPCRWQSRDATSLPGRGDACLVVFDENQEPWIPLWWPFNS